MIGFLQPLALLGLAAAAIPAILHLLNRRTPPVITFPAVRYIAETERAHSRRLKLRNLLLLVLRTAVIVFLVLAASRPVMRLGLGSGHPPTAVALVVDNSLSSSVVVDDGRRLLDHQVEAARAALVRVTEEDRLWLVLADAVPREMSRPEARALLDTLSAWPMRMDLTDGVSAAAAATRGASGYEESEIVIFSDLQRSALSSGEPLEATLTVWDPPRRPPNRGIDMARAVPEIWSGSGTVLMALSGDSGPPTAVTVHGPQTTARSVATPGDEVALSLSAGGEGWFVLEVAIDPDELRLDDVYYLPLLVAPPAAVTVGPHLGGFAREALTVLEESRRIRLAPGGVLLGGEPGAARRVVVVPPRDPALVGAFNRSLERAGLSTRIGVRLSGEWLLESALANVDGVGVTQRYRLASEGDVLAEAGGDPWLVKEDGVVVLASRLEPEWTELPLSAAFVPFLDLLVNRIAGRAVWIDHTFPGELVSAPVAATRLWVGETGLPLTRGEPLVAPFAPGVYFYSDIAGDTIGALAVNHPPAESRLERATLAMLQGAWGSEVRLATRVEDEMFGGGGRADLATLLLVAALLTGLLELLIASRTAAPD